MRKVNPVQRDLRDMIANAKAGDTADARSVVETLRLLLSHSTVGKRPLSPIAADFLIEALDAGLRGESINKVLGLTRRGRKNEWEWQAKAMSVRIVQDLMQHGLTHDEACERAAEIIGKHVAARTTAFESRDIDTINQHLQEQGQAWASFRGRAPSEWNCRHWYAEMAGTSK